MCTSLALSALSLLIRSSSFKPDRVLFAWRTSRNLCRSWNPGSPIKDKQRGWEPSSWGQNAIHHYKLTSCLFTGSQCNPQANSSLSRSLLYLSQKSNYFELWETEPCKKEEKIYTGQITGLFNSGLWFFIMMLADSVGESLWWCFFEVYIKKFT